MSRKAITLEIDPEHEDLLRRYADFLGEMKDLAASAPGGSVLDACEQAVIERGREQQTPRPGAGRPDPARRRRKKGAPLRRCPCGQAREDRGAGSREVLTCVGRVGLRRRRWGSRCACAPGGYQADATPGLDGGLSPRPQAKSSRLAAEVSFATTREHLREWPGVSPAAETIRVYCERPAARVARWQGQEQDSAAASRAARGGLGVRRRRRQGQHPRERLA